MSEIILNGKYRHYRNQMIYEVVGFARHSETYEEMVIYQGHYNCEQFGKNPIWVRPKVMFLEEVMHDGKLVKRFQRVI